MEPFLHPETPRDDRHRGIRILAGSLFRNLVAQGYSTNHVVHFTSELLGLVAESVRGTPGAPPREPPSRAGHERSP